MKLYIFIGLLLLSLFCGTGCSPDQPLEIPESSKAVEMSLNSLTELFSTFDIVQDYTTSQKFFMKTDESLLPNGVFIHVIDTSFKDGDGVEVELNFGSLGEPPYGLLAKDQKYRAGRIILKLNKPYNKSDAVLSLSFPKDRPFYSGDGTDMVKFVGDMNITRISDDEVNINSTNLTLFHDSIASNLTSNFLVLTEKDYGLGLINDEIAFDGTLKIEQGNAEYLFTAETALKKTYTLDCIKHISIGKIKVQKKDSKSEIKVDFDPDNDAACDNKIAITINDKTVIVDY